MIYEQFKIDCEKCFGFCCVALFFSKMDGFPHDKIAGAPCKNLNSDFSCNIHTTLVSRGLKGCLSYDCLGAGQKVAQVSYRGEKYDDASKLTQEMFDVFSVMTQLHEILWHLIDMPGNHSEFYDEIECLTYKSPIDLLKVNVNYYWEKLHVAIEKAYELDHLKITSQEKTLLKKYKKIGGRLDLIGKRLNGMHLSDLDLRGAYLIATDLRGQKLSGVNFLGADLRDADIRESDLSTSLFLTQAQVNAAIGNSKTVLPIKFSRPFHWKK